jgi:hypothetical protein
MTLHRLREEKGFLSLIAMLVTLAIVCYLVYAFFQSSSKSFPVAGQGTAGGSGQQSTTGYQNLVGQARSQMKNMNEKTSQTDKAIDELTK